MIKLEPTRSIIILRGYKELQSLSWQTWGWGN